MILPPVQSLVNYRLGDMQPSLRDLAIKANNGQEHGAARHLSKLIGVHENTTSRWIRRVQNVSEEYHDKLAAALNLSTAELREVINYREPVGKPAESFVVSPSAKPNSNGPMVIELPIPAGAKRIKIMIE